MEDAESIIDILTIKLIIIRVFCILLANKPFSLESDCLAAGSKRLAGSVLSKRKAVTLPCTLP